MGTIICRTAANLGTLIILIVILPFPLARERLIHGIHSQEYFSQRRSFGEPSAISVACGPVTTLNTPVELLRRLLGVRVPSPQRRSREGATQPRLARQERQAHSLRLLSAVETASALLLGN